MSCDVGELTESLKNDLCSLSCDVGEATKGLENELILQPSFRHFIYVTVHSPTLSLLHLRHRSFSNPSLASPTLQALHLRHLASRP